jgi:S1-C subfamily serine protease/cytochrome c-type biogenesis protein CcmH/NrfG
MSPDVAGLLCVGSLALLVLAVGSLIYDDLKRKQQLKPQPPPAGPGKVEYEEALARLKSKGSVDVGTPDEDRILADLAASGLARKEGNAYVYTGSRDDHQRDQESAKSGAPPDPAEAERESPSLAPSAPRRQETGISPIVRERAEEPRLPVHERITSRWISSIGRSAANVGSWRWGRSLLLTIPIAALACLLGWYWHAFSTSTSADTIFRRTSPAVVQVVVQDRQGRTIGSGSGFLVSKKGLIATNYHVIEKAHTADVFLADQRKLSVVGAAAFDQEADLAIIKVAGQIGAQPLELAGDDLPPVGAKVYAIGSPLGDFANTLSDGLVSGHRETGTIPHFPRMPAMIQTTAPISHGSSGGPLLRSDGKVVGLMTLTFSSEGENLNFAVPASHVARLLLRCEGEGQLTRFPLSRQPDALIYIERGNAWFAKRDYDQAIRDYTEAIRLDPSDAAAYGCRGKAWFAKLDCDEAIRDATEAIRLDPNEPHYYSCRSCAWFGKMEYDEAIRDATEAIRLDPSDAVAYGCRGNAWFQKMDYNTAIRDYTEAIRLDPTDATAYCFRGDAWSAKQDYDQAIRDYDQAIRIDPKYEPAYSGRRLAWSFKTQLRR